MSVSLLVTTMSPTEMDEPIEMPFCVWTRAVPRNSELLMCKSKMGGTHWHQLVNMIAVTHWMQ